MKRHAMTLAAAQQFILYAVRNPEIVKRINLAKDITMVKQILSELNMVFSCEEFEHAYFNVLIWCRTYDQADAVKEVKLWWDCLSYSLIQK